MSCQTSLSATTTNSAGSGLVKLGAGNSSRPCTAPLSPPKILLSLNPKPCFAEANKKNKSARRRRLLGMLWPLGAASGIGAPELQGTQIVCLRLKRLQSEQTQSFKETRPRELQPMLCWVPEWGSPKPYTSRHRVWTLQLFRSRSRALGPFRARRIQQSLRERLVAFRFFRSRPRALGPFRARRIQQSLPERAFSGV